MLQILGAPFLAPVAEMLEEDIGGPVEENQKALHELRGRPPFLMATFRFDVPRLSNS